ncbi:MAG: hypothetical protein ACKVYV_06060 [Limisphaerales bacterium]
MNSGEDTAGEVPLADAAVSWSLEEAVCITGLSRTEILRICHIVARAPAAPEPRLDAAALRLLGELDRLRRQCGLNDLGFEVVAELLAELHELRRELLRRR